MLRAALSKTLLLGLSLAVLAPASVQAQMRFYDPDTKRYVTVEPGKKSRSRAVSSEYRRQVVSFPTKQAPGTVIIDTENKFLYYVLPGKKAIRYGVGVGREGFTWSGTVRVGRKAEWPDWTPPAEMLERQPDLPAFMAGGPDNPLGARAIYLYSGKQDTLFRIHGTNEPWTIGSNVSSGCIRLVNENVVELHKLVKVGAKVIVL